MYNIFAMQSPIPFENEVKYKIVDPAGIRMKLRACGFKRKRTEKEIDYSFDTRRNDFLNSGTLIRLREHGAHALLTYKGPAEKSRFKKRLEINIPIDDFKKTRDFLARIGLKGILLKEKIRETYVRKKDVVVLDALPFLGYYLEIEGTDRQILAISKQLNCPVADAITDTYSELFMKFCRLHRKSFPKGIPLFFSFSCEKKYGSYLVKKKEGTHAKAVYRADCPRSRLYYGQ